MRTALNVARKDLQLLIVDPQTLIIQIAMPLILAIVVGFAMEGVLGGEERLRVAVVDLDRTAQSAQFIDDLNEGGSLSLKPQDWEREAFDRDDAADLLDDGKKLAVLAIPAGFGASLDGGPQATVQLYTDPAQRQFVRSVMAIVNGELQRRTVSSVVVDIGAQAGLSAEQSIDQLASAAADPAVSLDEQALVEGTSLPSGFDQTIPGFAVMFAMFMMTFVVIQVARERVDYGTWRRVLLSPAPRPVLLTGRLFSTYLLGVLQMLVLFGVGWLIFGIELGSVGGLAVAVAVFLLVPVAMGLFFSTFYGSLLVMIPVTNLVVIALGATGGSLVPIFFLPGWMEALAAFTPHYWGLQAFQDLMFRGADISDVTLNLAILLGFAAAFFAAGFARFSFSK
jgi:ABC-2 type transport system permease protein